MSNTVINTNIMAINAHRSLNAVGNSQAKASARLSSGLKVNSGADDAAGLAISEKLKAQVRGADMANKNTQDGISLIQTADGGLSEVNNMVQRIRELAVQASNDTNTTSDTGNLGKEVGQLTTEIDAMKDRTTFNTQKLLDGNFTNKTLQVGADQNHIMTISISDMSVAGLNITGIDASIAGGGTGAQGAITLAQGALDKISTQRATLGAYQNRLEHTSTYLSTASQNMSAANSRIVDADMAGEMMNLSKANVLQQAANSMLAQANQAPQSILSLLR